MVSTSYNYKEMEKVFWGDVRDRVAKVEPSFAAIVDEINPDQSFPLFLAYYPYGAIKGDIHSTLFPRSDGSYYRITDPKVDKEIITHLGYSKDSAPFALLIEKNVELFVDLPNERMTIPRLLYTPGSFFPFTRILSIPNKRKYSPNGVLTMTSGARSVFMLPKIGCAGNHANLQKDFYVRNSPAKSLYDHWKIFKEIVNANVFKSNWQSCLLYFSQPWLEKIHFDKGWMKLKLYLFELAWNHYEFSRSHFYYDLSVSIIQKRRNLKPNPYLADTAKHLIATALGAVPGYIPALNEDAIPKTIIQKAIVESYGQKKHLPTILQPSHFYFEDALYPIYYSLQHPVTHVFSPKSTAAASKLTEMRELERLMRIFVEELAKDNSVCSNTVIGSISKNVEFNYYHNKFDQHRTIKSTMEIFQNDDRFHHLNDPYIANGAKFASDAPFLRGCISITAKKANSGA